VEQSDHRHGSLLRERRERPRGRRAADERDKLAALQWVPLLRLRAGHYHTVAEERRCASQQKLRDDVADGSKAAKLRMSEYFPVCPQKRTFDLRVYESIPN